MNAILLTYPNDPEFSVRTLQEITGEGPREEVAPITNVAVDEGRVDLVSGFMQAYDYEEIEGAWVHMRQRIVDMPSSLILSVGLFAGGEAGTYKLFPRGFYFSDEEYGLEIEEQRYRLNSFVVHLGRSRHSGHYYTYIRKVENGVVVWYKKDDGYSRRAQEEEVRALFTGEGGLAVPYILDFSKEEANR